MQSRMLNSNINNTVHYLYTNASRSTRIASLRIYPSVKLIAQSTESKQNMTNSTELDDQVLLFAGELFVQTSQHKDLCEKLLFCSRKKNHLIAKTEHWKARLAEFGEHFHFFSKQIEAANEELNNEGATRGLIQKVNLLSKISDSLNVFQQQLDRMAKTLQQKWTTLIEAMDQLKGEVQDLIDDLNEIEKNRLEILLVE